MKYTEPKDKTAELLRLTLGHMGQHEAAFNPVTFTVWYEYAAGINIRLQAALDLLIREKARFDDARIAKLYQDYVAPADDAAMQRISGEIQRVMSGIAQSASQTGDRAGVFGAQLNDLTAALNSSDAASLSPHLTEALAGTAEMKSSADALQQQVAASQSEIARLRSDLDRARGEALTDPLTRILNRKGFDQQVQALFDARAAAGRQHCLVMFDIDHFKKVNDTHGHVMGDRVIQGVGEILRGVVAEGQNAAARYGGEEFAVVLPSSTLEAATQLAELVRARTKAMKIRHRTTQEVLFSITISGGVAALQPGDDPVALIARADGALYESKRSGRDRVSCG
jgi:diguanylate cyclase